jgi:quercetin dioxygenase-like cupin family protein
MQTTAEPTAHLAPSARAVTADVVWTLARGGLRSEHLSAGQHFQLTCLTGECWITLEGDPTDHVLSQGDTLHLTGPGLLVIEALDGPAKIGTRP